MSGLGILGGTFNPIHNGHIMLAEYCKKELALDKIILIPTYTPPHKESKDLASETHRMNMCKIACKNLRGYTVSDVEIKRKGKSYTYQTLNLLKEEYPNDKFYLIMGADMFLTLHEWKNPHEIFKNAVMTVIPRDKSDCKDLKSYYNNVIMPMGAEAVILREPVIQVSSTFVRENIYNAELLENLVDKNVFKYIEKNKLYRV